MRPSTTAPADSDHQLRAARDRFVGFAFAGGDLLLEVDPDGVIVYAAGAAQHLAGQSAAELLGRALPELAATGHRARLEQALPLLRREGRLAPLAVVLAGAPTPRPAWLAGHCADGAAMAQVSLRLAPIEAPGPSPTLPDPPAFERQLLQRLEHPAADERLTLVDLSPLESLTGLDADAAAALRAELGAALRGVAVDPEGAGWLSQDTLGVVHGAELDPAVLGADIEQLTRAADPDGHGVALAQGSLELDTAGLSPTDAGQALLYAINRFAETKGADFDIHSLREGLEAVVADTVARVAEYRGTVETESFELVFQPIVELATRRVHHYELLSRLEDGRSPFEMVTFAERLGMVAEFDLAVCRRVLDLLAAPAATVAIAVNLSARSLESELFARSLLALLDSQAAHRGRLLFELTESAAIIDPEQVGKVVAELRRRGIAVCLDDFGSGAAAFHYLRALRFDYVKIDGDYIRSTDHRDQAILRGMIGLCRELGVKTVAEMVETPLQVERLARLKVDLGQGYLFGRPGPLPTAGAAQGAKPGRAPGRQAGRTVRVA